MLYLAATQEENEVPYCFLATGVRVYTLEEAAYHVYGHWQGFVDAAGRSELCSEAFLGWVRDALGLPRVAARIAALGEASHIRGDEGGGGLLLGFLSVLEFYNEGRLDALRSELTRWEQRQGWERLKEQADTLYNSGEAQRAISLYRRTLDILNADAQGADGAGLEGGAKARVINNYAMALMKLYRFAEAAELLEQAVEAEPGNARIWLALAEASIRAGDTNRGEAALVEAELLDEAEGVRADAVFLRGVADRERGDYRGALEHFKQAQGICAKDVYVYGIAECYVRLRMYEQGVEALELLPERGAEYYVGLAEVRRAQGNIGAAIRAIEQAMALDGAISLRTKLARYHRLGYDLPKAEAAARGAGESAAGVQAQRAAFELAQVRKAQGHVREYQGALAGILRRFKQDMR